MDKLTAIKIKYEDGTYSDEIPVSVLSENVEWDNTHTLVDVLGSIDVDVTGTIQDQISQLFNEKVSTSAMQDYVTNSMPTYITNWLNTNVNPVGSAVVVDSSLIVSGAAADAKKTGDAISELKDELKDDLILFTGHTRYDWDDKTTRDLPNVLVQSTFDNWASVLVECSEGDIFNVKGSGGNNSRLWVFADSTGSAIESSPVSTIISDYKRIVAPSGTKYLACNSRTNQPNYMPELIKGDLAYADADFVWRTDATTDTIADIGIYSNIISPDFTEKSVNTSSSRTTMSDVVNVSSGKTYFGYMLVNISNLTDYSVGTMYLEFINTLDFVLQGKSAGNSAQPIQNGDIELYGWFTPSSSGNVKAVLYCNNSNPNYTFTAKVKKCYLFETSNDLSAECALYDYANPLCVSTLKKNLITYDNLDNELQMMISPSETTIIDCWGDSLTAGAGSTTTNYPAKLQTLVGNTYTVNNYGQGSETAEAVAFRQGAIDGIVEPFTASMNYVTVESLKSVNGASLGTLNLQGIYYGNNTVEIDGINYFYRRVDASHCKLARISGSSSPTYTRPMLVKAEGKGKQHIIIVCVGQNGWVNEDTETLTEVINNMIAYNDYDKYIVVGIPTGDVSTKSAQEQIFGSIFGNHFVNSREYISAWGCADNNITPTSADTEAMAIGAVPPSLKADSVHLNDYGYTAMANCIYARGKSLGYWS